MIIKSLTVLSLLMLFSCKTIFLIPENPKNLSDQREVAVYTQKENDSLFVDLSKYSNDFILDLKYATKSNFLKEQVYDCAKCYLRLRTVKALIKANKKAMKLGFKIKLFDCYRPLQVQEKMWQIMPNQNYVANPKKGSIHNKGGAVDLTLVNSLGDELNMGTDFDFFGKESSHDYMFFSDSIKKNRSLLRKIMQKSNFSSLNTEWWHYNLLGSQKNKVSNFKWDCD